MTTTRHGPGVLGPALALLSALSFALSGTLASSLMAIGWTPGAAVLTRIGVAALVLLVPGLLSLRGQWYLLRRHARTIVMFGLFAIGVAQLSYFTAVQYLSVGVALLIEYTSPILVVLWLWLRHGRRPRPLTIAGVGVAVVGLLFVLDLTGARVHPVGVMWSLLAACGAAVYFIIAGSMSDDLPTVTLVSGGMVMTSLLLAGAWSVGLVQLTAPREAVTLAGSALPWWVPALGLALISAVVAYVAGAAGARRLGSKLAAMFGLLEVLAAVTWAWLLLGQQLRTVQLLGGLGILAGVALVHLDERGPAWRPTEAAQQLPAVP